MVKYRCACWPLSLFFCLIVLAALYRCPKLDNAASGGAMSPICLVLQWRVSLFYACRAFASCQEPELTQVFLPLLWLDAAPCAAVAAGRLLISL